MFCCLFCLFVFKFHLKIIDFSNLLVFSFDISTNKWNNYNEMTTIIYKNTEK